MEQRNQLKESVLLIGEGITEFFYFESLKDLFPGLQMSPTTPKHTNFTELCKTIDVGIQKGYTRIFCVIDMDNKDGEKEKAEYNQLKQKYLQPYEDKDNGISCKVKFIETHRCTELFFLYYFIYTSKDFTTQDDLIKELCKHCDYDKTRKFFCKVKGLHSYFEKKGGSLDEAIKNAKHSMREKEQTERNYTYSELGELIETLKTFVTQ